MPRPADQTGTSSTDRIRTFICFEIPPSIKERIRALENELRRIGAQASWVKPENIHLTVKFLGDVDRSSIEAIRAAIERAALSFGQFDLEVSGAGCFPTARNPRVLWVGLNDTEGKLKQLHAAIEAALEREGFEREAKRFSPHLTIARLRSPQNGARLAEELMSRGFEPEAFTAREIVVMRSELHPSGSIYTPLAAVNLASTKE